jgi:hypothetical protein
LPDLVLPATLRPIGSTQLLTETSIRNLPGGRGRSTRKAYDLTVSIKAFIAFVEYVV